MAEVLSMGRAQVRTAGMRRCAVRWLSYAFFALALLFAAVAAALGDVFFFRLATESLIFGGLALSVDLLLGRTGLLPLGQALFFGFGAYVSALTLKHLAPSLPLALALVLISGTLVGLVGGLIAIRAKGVYFALISFGLAQVVSKIVFNTRELGASDGLIGVPAPVIHLGVASLDTAHAPSFFLLVLAGMAAVLALLTALKSVVGSFTAHHAIVIGALFVVSVIFFPKGLIGYLAPALERRWSRR